MSVQEYGQSFVERLQTSAHVKTIFGEPVESSGRTIIPVARVSYGFGGGIKSEGENNSIENDAGGGGGGLSARPLGIFEMSSESTRFVPVETNWKKEVICLLAGFGMGYLLATFRNNVRR